MPVPFTVIHAEQAPPAIGSYSQAVHCGEMLFLSGQIPLDPVTLTLVGEHDIEAQIQRVFLNMKAVLNAAGISFSHVLQLTIYLTDLNHFSTVNQVMQTFFSEPYPARATVQVSRLPKEAQIEVSAIATLREVNT